MTQTNEQIREEFYKKFIPKSNERIASWEGAPGEYRCILSEEGKNSYFKRPSSRAKYKNRYGHVDTEKGDIVRVWWDGENSPKWVHKDWIVPSVVDVITEEINLENILLYFLSLRSTEMKEVVKKWNSVNRLDHYDESNDSYWEHEYGNHHVISMHISEHDNFRDFIFHLSDNTENK